MIRYALIVAGGKGLRMNSELPKQFILLEGRPVLMYTLEAFYTYSPDVRIILVLPRDQQPYWADLCRKYHFDLPHVVADGGDTRFHSVKNGLAMVDESALVAVHDGVRPFVSREVIDRCYEVACRKQAVVPVLDIVETIRQVESNHSKTVNRDNYKIVQTPQVFTTDLLKKAYCQEFTPLFTDDASVVEALGMQITLVPGNRENIKITTSFDLKVAKALLKE